MSKIQTSLRIEEESLNEAKQILSRLGMNFSEAVNMFTCMIVEKNGLPFPVQLSEKRNERKNKTIDKIGNINLNEIKLSK